ncbi:MAG: nickel pincer cofactor biosynthesis protein LarC [Planctomycetales bacterium]
MKIAYLDCASGISGDMTLGALVDSWIDLAAIQSGIDSLGLPSCKLVASEVKKNGFRATQVTVEHEPEHAHRHLHQITDLIDGSQLSETQQDLAKRIFTRLGEAEAKVHGTTIEKVHFHEVGAVDSIADIVGAAIGWDLLQVDRIVASPIPTGTGTIQIAHGRCSIPAPATTELLMGIPLCDCSIEAELTTPTGAAVVSTLVDSFGPVPAMTIERIGCGAGQRDLESQPNLLRILVGSANQSTHDSARANQSIWVVETNLDDATGEQVGYLSGQLFKAGAVDVYTTPVQMKKNRPGVVITALCHPAEVQQVEEVFIRESPTLGVRRWVAARTVVRRQVHQVVTPWGPVDGMVAWRSSQPDFSPEYESCRRLAEEKNIPLGDVYLAARQAFDPGSLHTTTGQ